MLTYRATYALRPVGTPVQANGADTGPAVTKEISDWSLRHAAARAEWRIPRVAASRGWHPGATELIAVELVGESLTEHRPEDRAISLARELADCDEEAYRLVAAAAVVAGVG